MGIATYGDVNAAIDRLLNSRGQQPGGQQSWTIDTTGSSRSKQRTSRNRVIEHSSTFVSHNVCQVYGMGTTKVKSHLPKHQAGIEYCRVLLVSLSAVYWASL